MHLCQVGYRDAGREGFASLLEVAVWRGHVEGGHHGEGFPISEASKHWGQWEVRVFRQCRRLLGLTYEVSPSLENVTRGSALTRVRMSCILHGEEMARVFHVLRAA